MIRHLSPASPLCLVLLCVLTSNCSVPRDIPVGSSSIGNGIGWSSDASDASTSTATGSDDDVLGSSTGLIFETRRPHNSTTTFSSEGDSLKLGRLRHLSEQNPTISQSKVIMPTTSSLQEIYSRLNREYDDWSTIRFRPTLHMDPPTPNNHEPTFFLASAHLDSRPLYFNKPAVLRLVGLLRRGHSSPVSCTWLTGNADQVIQHSTPGDTKELSPIDSHSETYVDVMVTCKSLVNEMSDISDPTILPFFATLTSGSSSGRHLNADSSSSSASRGGGSKSSSTSVSGSSSSGSIETLGGSSGSRQLKDSISSGEQDTHSGQGAPALLSWVHVTVVQVLWNDTKEADPLIWPLVAAPYTPCPITSKPQPTVEMVPGQAPAQASGSKGTNSRRLTATSSSSISGGSSSSSSGVSRSSRRGRGSSSKRLTRGSSRTLSAAPLEQACDPSRTLPFHNKPPGSHLLSYQDYDTGNGGLAVCMAPLHGGDLQVCGCERSGGGLGLTYTPTIYTHTHLPQSLHAAVTDSG